MSGRKKWISGLFIHLPNLFGSLFAYKICVLKVQWNRASSLRKWLHELNTCFNNFVSSSLGSWEMLCNLGNWISIPWESRMVGTILMQRKIRFASLELKLHFRCFEHCRRRVCNLFVAFPFFLEHKKVNMCSYNEWKKQTPLKRLK